MKDDEREQRLWEMYLMDCRLRRLTPSLADYIIWKQEEGY